MNAIDEAIRIRHSKDLIVPECKNGPTQLGNHRRLDYWVLRSSWTRRSMIGYEVKLSRADFLRDEKWREYLPLCNELYFVAESGVIQKEELPKEVGLLRLAGSRLITVRRAVFREIKPPIDLLTYVLMCRAKITREEIEDQTEEWRRWLARRAEQRDIGRAASKAIRQCYEREVLAVRSENRELRIENEKLKELKAALEAAGISVSRWTLASQVIDELRAPRWTRVQVEATHKLLGQLLAGEDAAQEAASPGR